jgi:hypothetical protein
MDEDGEAEPLEVDFIPAFEDAKLRLDCFRAIAATASRATEFDVVLRGAQALYAWCMEDSDDALETEQLEETGDLCGRKH